MSKVANTDGYEHYEVFAREKLDGPLAHVGCVFAPNRELAAAQASMTYSEKPWVEMCVAPTASFIRCIGGDDGHVLGYA
jgi:1,2-phenylacetyl-CoA epoxidase PaaB subunit